MSNLRTITDVSVVIVCREAARGDEECHSAYLARYIHALLDKAHQSRQPSRASSPTTRQAPRMTPAVNIGAPSLSPVNQNTTPDQWWDEVVRDTVPLPKLTHRANLRINKSRCSHSRSIKTSGKVSLCWPER